MPLIACPECTQQISDLAPACPGCGVPIGSIKESKGSGTTLNTVQETSKKFKLQSILSLVLVIVSGFWLYFSAEALNEPSELALQLLSAGIIWHIVNRIRIWWHHK